MCQVYYIDQEYVIENKQNQKLTFDNGIEYVKYLRRVENFAEPVLFTSFFSLEEILQKPNTQILTAIGHDFLQLPYSNEDFEQITGQLKPLNEIQLSDIKINFCQLRSSVREGFHIFKGRLREIKGYNLPLINKLNLFNEEFTKYELELKKDVGQYPEILTEYKRIIALFNPNDILTIERIESIQEENFVCFLPTDSDSSDAIEKHDYSWKILFLDDKPSELDSVFEILKEREIKYEVATNCADAKTVIENDIYNQIAVVVSDYRLFEKPEKENLKPRMQNEQGYDFLIWLSKQNRHNAMVALSGLSKWFLLDSFRKNRINVKVYSKSGLLGGGAKLFVDDIEYLGTQFNEVLNNQPKASLWNEMQYVDKEKTKIKSYPLKPYYVYHRNNNDYLTTENNINQIAEKVAREVEFAIDKSSNFNFASLVSIQGNATKTMKGDIENEYPDFQLKLLQRRVFYYLILKGFDTDAIVKMLHKGDSQEDMSDSMIKQIPSMLAIKANTDIPYNLLVEEKYFLHQYMNLPIYNIAELMDQTYSIVNNVLSKYLNQNKYLAEALSNYCIKSEGQITVGTVSMTEVHVLLKKVVELLLDSNQSKIAASLIYDVIQIMEAINDLVPDKNQLKNSFDKLYNLQSAVAKKINT